MGKPGQNGQLDEDLESSKSHIASQDIMALVEK
jgi:hypothetical protein